jgi:hypothetical protein
LRHNLFQFFRGHSRYSWYHLRAKSNMASLDPAPIMPAICGRDFKFY